MNEFNTKNISKRFYDFVKRYDCGKYKKPKLNSTKLSFNIAAICNLWFTEESMYFVLLYDNEKQALKEIENMLNTKNGTVDLLGKLENTFDDLDCFISQIQDLDYLTEDFVTIDQFSTIVTRKFEYDDEFKEKDYFNLYIEYKDLCKTLKSYYELAF